MDKIKSAAKAAGKRIYRKLKEEPVLVMYGILFAVNAAALVGYNVPPDAVAKVDAFLVPFLAYLTRKRVAPIAKLEPMTPLEFVEKFGPGEE